MAVNEGLKPTDGTLVPIDPNVRVPDHVKEASAAADAIHQQFYPKDQGQAPAPNKEAVQPPVVPEPVVVAPEPQLVADAPPLQPQPEPAPAPLKPGEENITAEEWRKRFLSMQGRYQSSQRTIGSMEQQMTDLGQELVRTQGLLAQVNQAPHAPQLARSDNNHLNVITEEDRANFGEELIDLARRAAKEAFTPELEALRADNARLTQRVQHTGKRELFATLDGAVPNWRAINQSVQFKSWLRLPNVYTSQLRGNMLKAAVDGAEAPKVISLFKDFLAEAYATGQQAPSAQVEPVAPAASPRTPALDLETLAAPGRARPASGDSQVPSEKPIYSRADISKFYDDKRRGFYAGRVAEASAFEADLTAAQREGRIRG